MTQLTMNTSQRWPPTLVIFLLATYLSFSNCEDLVRKFVKAATKGSVEDVRALLQNGAALNAQIEHGYSALMMASSSGQEEIVKMLLAKGAQVNLEAHMTETALLLVALRGHIQIVEMLVEGGADCRVTDTGLTPLMMAAAEGHSKVVEYLLSRKRM